MGGAKRRVSSFGRPSFVGLSFAITILAQTGARYCSRRRFKPFDWIIYGQWLLVCNLLQPFHVSPLRSPQDRANLNQAPPPPPRLAKQAQPLRVSQTCAHEPAGLARRSNP